MPESDSSADSVQATHPGLAEGAQAGVADVFFECVHFFRAVRRMIREIEVDTLPLHTECSPKSKPPPIRWSDILN